MAALSVPVHAFDPAIPFKPLNVTSPAIDTWHTRSLITRKLWLELATVPEARQETLELSGGMSIRVPLVEVGVQIGSIKVQRVECLVVDAGYHELLLGSLAIEQAFSLGRDEARVASPWKDDAEALSLQYYPVEPWVDVRAIENMFNAQRRLYNVLLFAQRVVATPSAGELTDAVRFDIGIPQDLRLKLTWIDLGHIQVLIAEDVKVPSRNVRNRRHSETRTADGRRSESRDRERHFTGYARRYRCADARGAGTSTLRQYRFNVFDLATRSDRATCLRG